MLIQWRGCPFFVPQPLLDALATFGGHLVIRAVSRNGTYIKDSIIHDLHPEPRSSPSPHASVAPGCRRFCNCTCSSGWPPLLCLDGSWGTACVVGRSLLFHDKDKRASPGEASYLHFQSSPIACALTNSVYPKRCMSLY